MGLIVQSWVRNNWALWASRLALFALQLFVVTFILHRLEVLSTPLALGLLGVCGGIAVLGGIAATVALVQIWSNGGRGGLRSMFAIGVMLLALAWPAAYLPTATRLPAINDISTDLVDPPRIIETTGTPRPRGFLAAERTGPSSDLQEAGYPDLRPLVVNRTVAAAFDAARTIAKREGLDIVLEEPPKGQRQSGHIQAIDETLLMGFRDDVVIRVQPAGDQARIDVRSASRYGKHDFGRNAARIRRISRQLRARLDFALPDAMDDDADNKPAVKKKKKTTPVRTAKRPSTRPRPPKVWKKQRRRSRSTTRGEQARRAWQRE